MSQAGAPNTSPAPASQTPRLIKPKASQAGRSSPRERQKRGKIQKATPKPTAAGRFPGRDATLHTTGTRIAAATKTV